MNQRHILLSILCGCRALWAADAGTTSADVLHIGMGARAVAMGNAHVGLANDVYATYWNPAGLSQLQTPEAGFVHSQDAQNIQTEFAAYAHPHPILGTVAGSITVLNVGKFDAFDASGQPAGSVDANDMVVALSGGRLLMNNRRFGNQLGIGVTAKYLRERLDTVTASAWAADAGVFYAPGQYWGDWGDGWRFGATLRNLGTRLRFDEESFALPRSLVVGSSWTGLWMGEMLTFALDGEEPYAGKRALHAGIELWTLRLLVLRAGYTTDPDAGNGLRLGIGLRFKTLQFDYAFAGAGALGDAHRIGITCRFGTTPPDPLRVAQQWYRQGLQHYRKKHYSEALVDFNKALQIDPSHPEALSYMKKTYEDLKTLVPSR